MRVRKERGRSAASSFRRSHREDMHHILLIDDEPIIKLGIRKLLEDSEYRISATAGNGMEALSLMGLVSVDIVITDLKMPVMDGIELIRQLKASGFPGMILVLSNYSEFDLVRDALTEGAYDYLLKAEITRAYLLERLDKLSRNLNSRKHEAQKKEQLLASEKQLLCSRWQEYLRGAGALPAEAKRLLFPDTPQRHEYRLVLVSIESAPLSADRKKRLLPQMKEVLLDIFEISEYILCLQTDIYEICCIVPVIAEIADSDAQIRMIQRHFATYFNITPIISHACHAVNPRMLQKSYELCHSALGYHFYYPEAFVFPVPEYGEFQEGTLSLGQNFWREISQICRKDRKKEGQGILLAEVLQNFISECRTRRISPEWVVELFSHYGEYQLLMSDPNPAGGDRSAILEELRGSENASRLIEAALSFLSQGTIQEVMEDITTSAKKEVQDTIFYMLEHYTEAVTLEEIAQHVNLNKSYLCRLFKQETGKSVFSYLNRIRMEKGAQYIQSHGKEYSIKEIASLLGMEDPLYFTRRFKAYFGKSPSEYANEVCEKGRR